MAYKIKKRDYFKEESSRLIKKHPHHIPNFFEMERVSTRKIMGIPRRTHTKGEVVMYKEGIAKVHKVTSRGIWLETWKKPTKTSLAEPSGKIVFVPEKEAEHKVYPYAINMPIYFNPPMVWMDKSMQNSLRKH